MMLFGRDFSDEPQPMTLHGMSGWWSVPRQWFTKPFPDAENRIYASPNADFSAPVYVCEIGDDRQTFVFQDLYRDMLTQILP